jgi:catechol O-methyltransferase
MSCNLTYSLLLVLKVAVELGGYCGYSAVRIGRLLPEGSKFYSIEVSPVYAAIATQIIKFAGLQDKCEVLVGDSETVLNEFRDRTGQRHVDLFFIDHQKSLYLRDLKLIEKLDLLHSGSVIVADNVIMPGAPDYLAYIRANLKFKSAFYESNLEYSNAVDGVEVSVFQ